MAGEASKKSGNEKPSSSSGTTSSSSNSNALTSFLQKDAVKQQNIAGKAGIDWEEMSRGAYSTVSKMKSAKERMQQATGGGAVMPSSPIKTSGHNNNNTPTAAASPTNNRSPKTKAKTSAGSSNNNNSQGLSSFMERKNAHARTAVDSDDRSRGAHSTMSHNLKRRPRPTPSRSFNAANGGNAAAAGGTAATTAAPFFPASNPAEARREAAERKLATAGNPTKQSSSQAKSKKEKNLEMFMSRQKPLPQQDLEVRSAFTSIDKARRTDPAAAKPTAPMPSTKEDLLALLRSAATSNTSATDTTTGTTTGSSISPTKPSVLVHPLPSAGAAAPAATITDKKPLDNNSNSTSKTPPKKSPPKRTRSKKAVSSLSSHQPQAVVVASSSAHEKESENKGALPQESLARIYKSESFRHTKEPLTKFSSMPPLSKDLDKPQPTKPGVVRSQSFTQASSGSDLMVYNSLASEESSLLLVKPKAVRPKTTPTADIRNEADVSSHSRTGAAAAKGSGSSNNNNSNHANAAARSTPGKKKPVPRQQMSARRMHHAPERSIAPSPISGRRQSLKMSADNILAGGAGGTGGAATQNKKQQTPGSGSSGTVSRKKLPPSGKTGKRPPRRAGAASGGAENNQIETDSDANSSSKRKSRQPLQREGAVSKAPGIMGTRRKPAEPSAADEAGGIPSQSQRRTTSRTRRNKGGAGDPKRGSAEDPPAPAAMEDIFSFYTWSEARQDEANVQRERQILRESILDGGPLHRAYNRIVAV